MEQFLLGLLAGIALGMWGAILLYRYSGKAQPGWPFRSRGRDDVSPDDDYDEAYYAAQERARPQGAATAPPPVDTGKSAHGTVVYTDTRAGAPPWPAKTQAELDEEFDAVVADWPDNWTEDEEPDLSTTMGAGESPSPNAAEDAAEDPRIDDYARLIRLVDGDVEAAEALIEAERKRTPAVARSRLIENALLRLQYGQA